ncbi:50S ribosomal protein L19e [ANME-1 cluster archaeon ex4572_4]|mgnify:CR=1 FL=1|nr:50S ribosomal protein L19e [Methanophagales archaeon]OYT67211.1 MAG: 50S ribosomal protein L19e [ANME-1 cluster archaeon ex4572_4]PXF51739.1 MAG: 50S ribosomal protein L19e [Methanophagales archaeon]HDN68105.1 50S ribosomal protein L19e [Methanomicrobia archaeon]
MANLAKQKRMAAAVLKVGTGRVWIDPEVVAEVAEAITREDIRDLIADGFIKKEQKKGVSRGRARERAVKKSFGRRKGQGSRKGAKGARRGKKRLWITRIRSLRRRLRELRDDEERIDRTAYRKLYKKARGGEFRSVAHLTEFIKANGLEKE